MRDDNEFTANSADFGADGHAALVANWQELIQLSA